MSLSSRDWALPTLVILLSAGLTLWVVRRTREAIQRWFRKVVLRTVRRFEVRLERYKLVNRRIIRDELMLDRAVHDAILEHCRAHGVTEAEARARVEQYIDEIVPFFNVLSYYKAGYNVSRVLLDLLYHVSTTWQDRDALNAIPRRDVVVYVMNHRSNADYVVVAYVLAHGVAISYAVGEWARTWPLEYIFKSFGSYFIRRRYREPLYHTVLERYVQLVTRNGVTQGIFLEGGLTRNGTLRPAKIGLLDYIARTLLEPEFDRDIWLVPVALNYDRVLEDRSLIRELVDEHDRPGRIRQLAGVAHYVTTNLVRLTTRSLKRYGRVAINFGTPISLRAWTAEHPGALRLPKEQRLPVVQRLADEALARIASIVPVTPVPLVAAALLSFGETLVGHDDLLDRIDSYRDHLVHIGAKVVPSDQGVDAILDRAWRMLRMRRLVVREGNTYVILPRQRPLLEYYANSILHLLPGRPADTAMHPARDRDRTLPTLRDG